MEGNDNAYENAKQLGISANSYENTKEFERMRWTQDDVILWATSFYHMLYKRIEELRNNKIKKSNSIFWQDKKD